MNKYGITALVIGIPVLIAGTYAADRVWTYYFGATIEGKVGAEKKLENSDSRISKYNHFYDLCSSVKSLEVSLQQQQKSLQRARENNNKDEISRLQTNIDGLVAQRARSVNQYNVDSRKEYTKARFKASDLPYQLPLNFEPNSSLTSCN